MLGRNIQTVLCFALVLLLNNGDLNSYKDQSRESSIAAITLKNAAEAQLRGTTISSSQSVQTSEGEQPGTNNAINEDDQSLPPRLELLHIQKTAGVMLEVMAMNAGIPWGICHFESPWERKRFGDNCPKKKLPNNFPPITNRAVYWHWPLQYLRQVNFTIFPYDNYPDEDYVKRPAKYFIVVRNPYERLLSGFYFTHRGNKAYKTHGPNAVLNLNRYVQEIVQHGSKVALPRGTHSCQYQYAFDDETHEPIPGVEHILQFEYLKEDFDPLAEQYGLDLRIPPQKENAHDYNASDQMTIHDFTTETLNLINTVCKNDFSLARGYEMIWEQQQRTD